MAVASSAVGLRALSILMGTFILFMGLDKFSWLTDTSVLAGRFQEWLQTAPGASRWYLERIAMPGTPVFARLVPVAEMGLGIALVCGFRVRWVAALALFMVLNFHFASDVIFHYRYLTNAYGLPVLGGLLALMLGGARLPLSVST
jgi:uncharacterized membrane protein YphA (DoxX/SURF4 family)